ncbi:MAG: DNA polymerase IV, partial [Bacteroidota bacterium]
ILSELPVELLQREFGKPGISLWKKANAIDPSPVVPYDEQKSMSSEMTFQTDTIDVRWIRDQLSKMVSKLAFELRQRPKLCSCITVKIRYSDFNTFTKQKRIPYTANDNILIELAHELFDSLYERRQLIRLIGVRLSGLVHGNFQLNLFDTSVEEVNLLKQLDRIRNRFGANAIMRASSLGLSRSRETIKS